MSATASFDIPVGGGKLGLFRLDDGPGTAEPVVAVHGITANSRAWLPVARALEGRAALLAVDLRGRGASSALPPPYGMEAYARDLLAVLDACGLERAVLVGHSLGAYAVARLAADRPDRVRAAVLVDGGLTSPGLEEVDPEPFLAAFLGPALARLELTFADREAYHDWWRAHPALAGSDVADSDLVAYANHDLGGALPELRSTVAREAVRADAHELFEMGKPAHRLTMPVEMLRAPRGLQNEPAPMIAPELAAAWADGAPDRRRVTEVPGVNHYTIVMGASGARAVAQAIVRALQTPADDPALRSAR
ncbi:MAG TPA: alpha/beta fold hydrolase [Solirubrobacteraceae bacterium]|nr:alpha/beta fold hydrolase [Solirubrobacteraceae bacterium]